MSQPPRYDRLEGPPFGGRTGRESTFADARVAFLPVPLDRTCTYVPGTRNGPQEILAASAHMELWDEELGTCAYEAGLHTLPPMELPFGEMEEVVREIERVASAVLAAGKFLVVLGGEHSITPPVVAAAARQFAGLSVLQIDAHADLRDAFMGSRHNHACAMRRVLEHARLTQVGIRSLSTDEAAVVDELPTRIFYDGRMREQADWIDRVVETLGDPVYITIDCDGLDPAIMPAVGTPEPGGLSWPETLRLLRATFERRTVVACDVVELCPIPGIVAPSFLAAKLVYKMLTYKVAAGR